MASAAQLEACFAAIERAACEGARCPFNQTETVRTGVRSDVLAELTRAGRIKVEISGQNYRTITLLTGPHAGKRTRPDPSGQRTWKMLTAKGTFVNGERYDAMQAQRRRQERFERAREGSAARTGGRR